MTKIKEHINYTDGNDIWRILISAEDILVLETRDRENKEVFFHTVDLSSGKMLLQKMQTEEKFWVGIENIYKDVILLHRYEKPDMPGHTGIIALSAKTGKEIWKVEDSSFFFVYEDVIYTLNQKFDSRDFHGYNYLTGEPVDIPKDFNEVNRIKNLADRENSFSEYTYSTRLDAGKPGAIPSAAGIKPEDISDEITRCDYGDLTFISYHKIKINGYDNYFIALNRETGEVITNEVIDTGIEKLLPESFFIYKNFLVLLKEKKELLVYKLEE